LQKSQLLADTTPRAWTKTDKCKRVNSIALALPSLRSECPRIFKIFRTEMISFRLDSHYCPLTDGNITYEVVLCGNTREYSIDRTVKPCSLVLNPIDIGKFLQILKCDVLVCCDDRAYLHTQSRVNLRVFANIVDHHCQIMGCCISASNQKCLEFVN
jgi:hypothetical protein